MKRRTIEHYEIIRRLGAGGRGVVYLANDTLLQRPVVLKILRAGLLSAQQMRTTVLREARLASAIEHPNVCAIYEVGEAGDEGYGDLHEALGASPRPTGWRSRSSPRLRSGMPTSPSDRSSGSASRSASVARRLS